MIKNDIDFDIADILACSNILWLFSKHSILTQSQVRPEYILRGFIACVYFSQDHIYSELYRVNKQNIYELDALESTVLSWITLILTCNTLFVIVAVLQRIYKYMRNTRDQWIFSLGIEFTEGIDDEARENGRHADRRRQLRKAYNERNALCTYRHQPLWPSSRARKNTIICQFGDDKYLMRSMVSFPPIPYGIYITQFWSQTFPATHHQRVIHYFLLLVQRYSASVYFSIVVSGLC